MMNNAGEQNNAFLDVQRSLTDRRWVDRLDLPGRNQALTMAQQSGINELLARIMAGRGVGADDVDSFLDPTIRDLMPDPSVLTDMDAAAMRLAEAITNNQRVAIFGDYDVDGAASSALLSRFLTAHGVENEIYIPHRVFEGYGPNPEAVRQLAERGAKLIVTVDCGATSFAALEEAQKLKADVIVLDHHQMGLEKPFASALVNPNRQDDLSGLGHLCAGGVVFMALVAVQRELRTQGIKPAVNLLDHLDLVALATVCDVVPLEGLNRAFVIKGLQVMRSQQNTGLAMISRVARLTGPVSPYHLGFVIGPRINAGGRIGDAALGSRLLTSEDPDEAQSIANQLEALNKERQATEAIMLEEAISEAEAEIGECGGPSVLVTGRKGWHPGIVGLLASRLKDRFRRPAIAIAFDGNGVGTGSGRSVVGTDLGKAVREALAKGHLEKGGGHAMAAGMTVKREKLGDLRAFLEDRLGETDASASEFEVLKLDGALTARGATVDFCELVERAGPYGAGNPQPVFAFPNHRIRDSRVVGCDHVSVTIESSDGKALRGIAFRIAEQELGQALLQSKGQHLHIAGMLNADFWQGARRPQLRIVDAAIA